MASTTPTSAPPSRARSASRTRNNLPSRPTTPLRPHSRTSLRASITTPTASNHFSDQAVPLEALEPAFGELADGMADLEANMMHLQLLHESLNRFNECFGAFLYGMNMSAFCVDFPEAPGIESFKRAAEAAKNQAQQDHAMSADVHHRERDYYRHQFRREPTYAKDNSPEQIHHGSSFDYLVQDYSRYQLHI
ncbi:hypothetical protein E4T50_09706 [Aureobasidium sp. EXF-12298]|nr:hypothetical protein E4T50_09706 [Aureobasidium sp. EXF-12298]